MRKKKPGPRAAARFCRAPLRLAPWALPILVSGLLTRPAQAADELQVPEAFEACTSCHTYEPDEPLQEAPPLWGVVGRRIASVDDFEYSPALKAVEGSWSRAMLDRFLTNPKAMVPGTAMKLGGVPDAAERATVLDFLEKISPARLHDAAGN
jgi:cytochrome c2